MTLAMISLINDLQGNMEVIGEFMESPVSVLEKYGIYGKERRMLLTKDLAGLNELGLEENEVYGALLSGAHSQQCSCHHMPNCQI